MTSTEHERMASVREARADLIVIPAMPVRTVVLPDDGPEKRCTGCLGSAPADSPRAFADADGCLWCETCATSDVIGAALTRDELGALWDRLAGWTAWFGQAAAGPVATAEHRALADTAAELRELRDLILQEWLDGRPSVPNPFGLAFT